MQINSLPKSFQGGNFVGTQITTASSCQCNLINKLTRSNHITHVLCLQGSVDKKKPDKLHVTVLYLNDVTQAGRDFLFGRTQNEGNCRITMNHEIMKL